MSKENTIKFTIETENRALEDTRKRIEDIKSEMIKTKDVDTFNKLALEAGGLETEIKRVEDAVTSLAGSGSELTKMSNSFNRVGASLLSMDFGAAAEEAGRLASISKTMNFGTAISSVKDLGKTFLSLGKALLTNPFFLLISIVTAIGIAIYKLLDELGLITLVFDKIGEAIQWVIDKIKELLDWLGLTDYEGENNAKNTIERNEKVEASINKLSTAQANALDHEIALRRINGEDTEQLEREKLTMLQTSLAEQIRLAEEKATAIIRLHGKDSDEYKKQVEALESLTESHITATRQIELFEAQVVKDRNTKIEEENKKAVERNKARRLAQEKEAQAIADAQLKADLMIEKARIEFIDDEIERALQMALFNEQQAFESIDFKKLTDEQKEILEQQHQDKILAIEQDATDKRTALAQKLADEKQVLRLKELQEEIEADKILDDERKKAEKEREEREILIAQNKRDLADSVIAGISANLKEGSKLAKGVAVGQATIDTYRGAQSAYATAQASPLTAVFPAYPFLAMAGAVAVGVANVRKILSTNTESASGGGGASAGTFTPPSLGSRQEMSNTPSMNLNNSVEQNAGGSSNRGQVMVVDYTDIANKGKEINGLQSRVSLG